MGQRREVDAGIRIVQPAVCDVLDAVLGLHEFRWPVDGDQADFPHRRPLADLPLQVSDLRAAGGLLVRIAPSCQGAAELMGGRSAVEFFTRLPECPRNG
jgi:hypothetical protein